MRIAVVAGGTGGHLFPALALFRTMKEAGHEARLVCRKGDPSMSQRLSSLGDEVVELSGMGLRGRKGLAVFRALGETLKALREARRFMKSYRPDVVVSFGGYMAFAPSVAGKNSGAKIVLIEQNSVPGLANRWLVGIADKVILNYERTKKWFKKGRVIGNPVDPSIGRASRADGVKFFNLDSSKKTILVIGGSQGAKGINEAVLTALESFSGFNMVWASGRKHYDGLAGKDEVRASKNLSLVPFIERMDLAWAVADVVLCRGGASTLSEMKRCRVPGIIVPYPWHNDRQQYYNGMELRDRGCALLVEEKDLTAGVLIAAVNNIFAAYEKFRDNFGPESQADVNGLILQAITE